MKTRRYDTRYFLSLDVKGNTKFLLVICVTPIHFTDNVPIGNHAKNLYKCANPD